MSVNLINFQPIGTFNLPKRIGISDDGIITEYQHGGKDIDLNGSYLSAGWCDLHVHIWYGGTDISVRADDVGRATGVTALADAGSAGEATFHGLREYVIEPGAETIKSFLNIGSIGLVACNRVSELIDERFIDVERTMNIIEANRDVICGVKVRASGVIVGDWGITPAKIAKRVAELMDLPLMVHIGEAPPLIDEVFEILTPGDIVTHCFNGKKDGSIRGTKKLFEMAKRLSAEGILMDIGHGVASFDFNVARSAMAEGLIPYSISTDLHHRNLHGPVLDMATTMSKMLAVGMDFHAVVEASTNRPRKVLNLKPLAIGEQADFTIFDLNNANMKVKDSMGETLILSKIFEPRMTIMGSDIKKAKRRCE